MGGSAQIGFQFRERLSGPMAAGTDDPMVGAARGQAGGTVFVADLRVSIEDLAGCVRDPQHAAQLGGTATFPGLATAQPLGGQLLLYVPDPGNSAKLMRYRFRFRSDTGADCFFDGTKVLHTPRASTREQVTLYSRVYTGTGSAERSHGSPWGAGILVFRLRDVPTFLLSMRATGTSRLHGLRTFLGFARRELTTAVTV
jgi:hypothetical protein